MVNEHKINIHAFLLFLSQDGSTYALGGPTSPKVRPECLTQYLHDFRLLVEVRRPHGREGDSLQELKLLHVEQLATKLKEQLILCLY